jgi:hypothetical protein
MADIAALRPIVNGLSKNPLRPKKIFSVINKRGSVCASKDAQRRCAVADGGHSRKETGKAAACGIFLGDFAVIERFSNLGMTDDQFKIIGSISLNWSIVEVGITDIL